jgi:AAA15 family ATPase/GTPase
MFPHTAEQWIICAVLLIGLLRFLGLGLTVIFGCLFRLCVILLRAVYLAIVTIAKMGDYGSSALFPRRVSQVRSNTVVIAVMGPTGVGKSSFIKALTGAKDIVIGHGLTSGE